MDLLKSAIAQTKKQREELKDISHLDKKRKWIKTTELEDARKQKYLQENSEEPPQKKQKLMDQQQDQQQEESMAKSEVFRLLREMGEPVTLFGEQEDARIVRLRRLQLNDEYEVGQRNDFAKILKQEEKQVEEEWKEVQRMSIPKQEEIVSPNISTIQQNLPTPKPEETKSHFVRKTLKRILKEWDASMEKRSLEERKTAQGKYQSTIFSQTKMNLKPLFKLLKRGHISDEVMNYLYNICHGIVTREYVKAYDEYLQLAIGNAPWPIGVTSVGIHARSARDKIERDKIAHVLNDDQQRKYIQSVKRLLTFAQHVRPTDPSKMVLS